MLGSCQKSHHMLQLTLHNGRIRKYGFLNTSVSLSKDVGQKAESKTVLDLFPKLCGDAEPQQAFWEISCSNYIGPILSPSLHIMQLYFAISIQAGKLPSDFCIDVTGRCLMVLLVQSGIGTDIWKSSCCE